MAPLGIGTFTGCLGQGLVVAAAAVAHAVSQQGRGLALAVDLLQAGEQRVDVSGGGLKVFVVVQGLLDQQIQLPVAVKLPPALGQHLGCRPAGQLRCRLGHQLRCWFVGQAAASGQRAQQKQGQGCRESIASGGMNDKAGHHKAR